MLKELQVSDNRPQKRRDFSAALNGIPSALDEFQYHRIIRDFGNIESKGLQLRATSTEIGRVHAHILEVMTQNALAESRLRDIAAEELTAEELALFESEIDQIREEFFQVQKENIRIGSRQMTDNIRQQPIETAKQNRQDEREGGGKRFLRYLGFEESDEKGGKR